MKNLPADKARYKGKKPPVWWENKIERTRSFLKPYAARASRFGAPAGVSLLILITLYSLFSPKDRFQLAKEKILKNPNDLEAHLILVEEFLKNNQLNEAEKELSAANIIQQTTNNREKVLGLTSKLDELWQKWQEENPKELEKLITDWEKFVSENPTYRDGWLRLALYNFKLGDKEKAKDSLNQALKLDPNFETSRELRKAIGD